MDAQIAPGARKNQKAFRVNTARSVERLQNGGKIILIEYLLVVYVCILNSKNDYWRQSRISVKCKNDSIRKRNGKVFRSGATQLDAI